MKKIILPLLVLCTTVTNAQAPTFADRFSLEAGYGYVMPMGTFEIGSAADFSDFKSLHIGAHYKITDVIGARFSYNFADFQHTDSNYWGSDYHRFTLEGTYDVYKAIIGNEFPYRYDNKFEGLVHAGAGVSFSQPNSDKSILDKGLGIQVGLQPKYYITNQLSIFLDVSYVVNMQRDRAFDGVTTLDGGSTSYVTGVIGLNYKFGN